MPHVTHIVRGRTKMQYGGDMPSMLSGTQQVYNEH